MIGLDFPARRPWPTLAVFAGLVAVSILGLTRMHPDPSMASLLPRHDPAAAALGHVLSDFTAVDDLQVMVSTPADRPADQARLLRFAREFESALHVGAGSPRPLSPTGAPGRGNPAPTTDLVESVEYKPAGDVMQFFADSIAPAGVDYLSDVRYAAAKKRLTRPAMDEQLRQDETMLAAPGPAAGGISKALIQDPLRLREFIADEFHDRTPAGFGGGGTDGLFSPDGRSLLIRVGGNRPLDDLEYAHKLTDLVTSTANQVNTTGLRIDISGGYAIAAESESKIRRDMIVSTVSSVVLLQILFVIAYRKPFRYFLLAFLPVAIGLTLGFGVRSLISTTISPAAAVVGAVLAGMGIDYTVLYLPHYQRARLAGLRPVQAVGRTSGRLLSPLVAACITSMIGFGVVGGSSVPALTDFAIVGSLGLIGSLMSAVVILPAFLAITDSEKTPVLRYSEGPGPAASGPALRSTPEPALAEPPRPRFRLEPFVDLAVRSRRPLMIIWAILGIAAIAIIAFSPGPLLALESDLTVMHPRPNPPLDAEAFIAKRMGFDPGSMQIYLHADSDADLVAAAYDVSARLSSPAVKSTGVVGTYGLSTWLPDPRAVARRKGDLTPAEVDKVIADFHAAVEASSFDPAAFAGYVAFLRQTLTGPPAPTVATLAAHPLLAKTMLSRSTIAGRDDHEAITVVLFDKPLDTRDQREAAVRAVRDTLADVPAATVTGLGVVGLDTEAVVRSDLPKLILAAIVLHIVYLWVHLRRWSSMVMALTPATVALLAVAAFLRLTQQKLNMVNLISLPLLIGIAVDYGIYVVSLARPKEKITTAEARERVTTSGHSILISATANVLGFGSLVTVSVPAIRSLGFAVGVGVTACFAATMLLLVPLLIREKA